ncbi:MAG: hypothetical protein ABIE94_04380 [archaeon]
MKEITIEQAEEKAKSWQEQGKKWHFHMLTPDCVVNKNKEHHAFVLENRTDDETFVVYSDKRYMEEGQRLVQLIHGNKLFDKEEQKKKGSSEKVRFIVEKAKELNKKGIHWHHHILFPDCIFNKHPGKWVIVFEDKETGETKEVLYDEEPIDDMRETEMLYYAQKE